MTFLKIVYNKDKKMFVVFSVFIILSFITTIFRREIMPFFTWSMYSYPEIERDTNVFYLLEYNNKVYNYPNIWDHNKRIIYFYTISYYFECIPNNGYDNTQIKLINLLNSNKTSFKKDNFFLLKKDTSDYIKWLKRYIENVTNEKIYSLNIYRMSVNYTNGKQNVLKKELVLSTKTL